MFCPVRMSIASPSALVELTNVQASQPGCKAYRIFHHSLFSRSAQAANSIYVSRPSATTASTLCRSSSAQSSDWPSQMASPSHPSTRACNISFQPEGLQRVCELKHVVHRIQVPDATVQERVVAWSSHVADTLLEDCGSGNLALSSFVLPSNRSLFLCVFV